MHDQILHLFSPVSTSSTYLVFFLLSCIISLFFSEWIDACYRKEPDTLSYPSDIRNRNRFRKPFLSIFLFLCMMPFLSLPLPLLVYHFLLISFLLCTICTDFEQHVIYDVMLLPFALLSLPFFPLLPLPAGNHLMAAFAGGSAFLLLAILTGGGIGGGDIKLIFVLGLWLGAHKLLAVILLGFFLGGFAALFLLLTGKKKRRDFLAYGPYFAGSAILLSILWQKASL